LQPPLLFLDTLGCGNHHRKHSLDQTSTESIIAEVSKLSLDIVNSRGGDLNGDLDQTLPLN
jgi:hypothetical protein